jgi:glycosyltransferase involved in cell wall biosynthesis
MRLLLINYEYPPIGGGAGNATMFIGRALVALGHEVTVLTAAWGPHQGESNDDGILLCRVKSWRPRPDCAGLLEMGTFALVARWHARELVQRRRIEGVIVFFTFPCGPVAQRIHRRFGVPYVVSLRGADVPGLEPRVAFIHRWLKPWRRSILKSAKAIVANDRGLAERALAADHLPVETIWNGVDTHAFSPGGPRSEGPFRWMFAGRFQAQKNLPFLLESLARVRRSSPPFVVSMVGDGPLFSALQAQAAGLGLDDIIEWHRWVGKPAMRELYRRSDGFLNPSHYEGMPNTVLEAMACGLPIVASAIPGNDTLVEPGKTGWLFPLSDPAALDRCLREAMGDPEEARARGAAGRARAEREFSWTKAATGYLDMLGQTTHAGAKMNHVS